MVKTKERGKKFQIQSFSGTCYYFRAASIDKNGLSPCSSVKAMIAL